MYVVPHKRNIRILDSDFHFDLWMQQFMHSSSVKLRQKVDRWFGTLLSKIKGKSKFIRW